MNKLIGLVLMTPFLFILVSVFVKMYQSDKEAFAIGIVAGLLCIMFLFGINLFLK